MKINLPKNYHSKIHVCKLVKPQHFKGGLKPA